ncbi:hypothetical protein LNP26_03330 [Klebsiella variicola subsp. variicola]|nr:hypothetical protein [Klebsiella variicola subsp. variicola]
MLQDLLGVISPGLKKPVRCRPTCWRPRCASWRGATSCIRGVVDPLGGINTLWPLFGIANQMLAGMALDALRGGPVQDETPALRVGARCCRQAGC